MIQITPQMRILLAVEPVDFRNYVEFIVMWSYKATYINIPSYHTVLNL